jgi:hypothetical protein
MASMLGTNRPAVSVIALDLKRSHAIDYGRRKVRIVDRLGLEEFACECYRTARSRIAHLLPPQA